MRFCLIGEKLSHSFSAEIHEKKGGSYELIELKREELLGFFENFPFDGCNVTVPYKSAVIPYLYGLSDEAMAIGAVNTVVKKDGKLYGCNTDIGGFSALLERSGYSYKEKHALILGSGGAAKAVLYALTKMGVKSVQTVSRTGKWNYENCYALTDTQMLINATPVGMYPNTNDLPVDIGKFPKLEAVFDCVYNPVKTKLVIEAEKRGLVIGGGLFMLVEQALLARDVWLEQRHEPKDTKECFQALLLKKSNLVLSGMAGAGKTTVGKLVAKALLREFYDVDEEIFSRTNKTSAEFIKTLGEERFREIESEVIADLSKKSGIVIALGGGSVLSEKNIENLKQNGVVGYLEREVEFLSDDNRPLSKKIGAKTLFEKRKPIYEKTMDFKVKNAGEIDRTVKEMIKGYEDTCYKRS